ncbi:hypothetical protein AWV79_30420 [Cupriavidus sp. UYMMa02A]|nr:hypothetical protein AWV79_30420 [Cupriavidus sp. UYMMa02A]
MEIGRIDVGVGTSIVRGMNEELAAARQRSGTSEAVAGAVAFLAGPDAGYISGTSLRVDGGLNV